MCSHLVRAEGDVGAEDDGVALSVGVKARYVDVVNGCPVGAQVEEVPQIEEQVGGGHRCVVEWTLQYNVVLLYQV
jgi:hypothetical protein